MNAIEGVGVPQAGEGYSSDGRDFYKGQACSMADIDLDEKDDPRFESRALCGLMATKEFLVFGSILTMLFDICYLYYILVRATGNTSLPFPWSQDALHEASLGDALNWFEVCIYALDLMSVIVLSLSGRALSQSCSVPLAMICCAHAPDKYVH